MAASNADRCRFAAGNTTSHYLHSDAAEEEGSQVEYDEIDRLREY